MINYYPQHTRYSVSPEDKYQYLWVYLTPKKLSYKKVTEGKILSTIKAEPIEGAEMAFLAPLEMMEATIHQWTPVENVIGQLLEKVGKAAGSLTLDTETYKADTPLIYRGSDRRRFELLIYLSVYDDPYKDVLEPVNILRKYAAPRLGVEQTQSSPVGGLTDKLKVELPTIFGINTKIGTKTVNLINIKNAALTSVAPTFRGPYIDGIPSVCELTLSFEDMDPLSKDSFPEGKPVVTVTRKNERHTDTGGYGGYNVPGDITDLIPNKSAIPKVPGLG